MAGRNANTKSNDTKQEASAEDVVKGTGGESIDTSGGRNELSTGGKIGDQQHPDGRNADNRQQAEANLGAIGAAAEAQPLNDNDRPSDPEVTGSLRQNGPTIEQWVEAGADPAKYPPEGFAELESEGLSRYRAGGVVFPDVEVPNVNNPVRTREDKPASAQEIARGTEGAKPGQKETVLDTKDGAIVERPTSTLMPISGGGKEVTDNMKLLLLATCEKFGVNPTQEVKPRELRSWDYYPADHLNGVPPAVVIVTNGGVKLKNYADESYPMDPDTQEQLRQWLQLAYTDPKTKEVLYRPFPNDMALPIQAVTGQVNSTAHQFRRGYLHRGDK